MHRLAKSLCLGFICAGLLAARNDDDVKSSTRRRTTPHCRSAWTPAARSTRSTGRTRSPHLLVRSSTKPRLLVVFPAGNSGTGLWFDDTAQPVNWSLDTPPSALSSPDSHGRPLYGIGADVSVDTNTLTIRQGVLSNVRFLRDFNGGATTPQEILAAPTVQGSAAQWQRDRIDGAPGYSLRITLRDGGNIAPAAGGKLVLSAPASRTRCGCMSMRCRARRRCHRSRTPTCSRPR